MYKEPVRFARFDVALRSVVFGLFGWSLGRAVTLDQLYPLARRVMTVEPSCIL